MDNFDNILKKLYNKETFYQKYGTDVIISLLIIYFFLVISFYYYLLNHIPEIKKNWPQKRCSPLYLPFAGLIINDPKKTNLEQIEENFSQCTQNVLVSILNTALEPIYFALLLVTTGFNGLNEFFNTLRALYGSLRKDVTGITSNIENRILNVSAPILKQNVTMKNAFNVTIGILTTTLYNLFGSYYTLKAFGGSIIQIINELILIPLSATIAALIALAAITGGASAIQAAALTVIYLSIMIPLLVIESSLAQILHVPVISISGP